jgi:predicted regulator of Ras-like GTPase activity (Roadblock/LC7/MglB family)
VTAPTPFAAILRRAVERVPGAIGAIFAAWDGEAVDSYHSPLGARDDLLVLGAHYGIILNHVQSVLHLTHFGEAEEIILQHKKVDLVVRAVDQSYYVVLAVGAGAHLATALREVLAAASALRQEM